MSSGAFVSDLESESFRTFLFPETVFTAVTAYQNQLVSLNNYITCSFLCMACYWCFAF